MKKMTEQHLINAFGGESQANMRYLHFADQAEKEKLNNTARLFRAIAHAEYIHAGDHYQELKHLETSANNRADKGRYPALRLHICAFTDHGNPDERKKKRLTFHRLCMSIMQHRRSL